MPDYLLFDFETIPNKEAMDNLRVAYEPEVRDAAEVSLSKMTIEDVKSFIERGKPHREWITSHIEQELDSKKPRKGVIDALNERIRLLEDPIPDKWKVAPELQLITTFGFSEGPHSEVVVWQFDGDIPYDQWVRDSLVTFTEAARGAVLAGWNIAGFDIPILMHQSRVRGINSPVYNIHSYSGKEWNMLDIMKARFGRDLKKLRDTALVLGMPREIDSEDTLVTGSNVAKAYEAGDYESIKNHCRVDILRLQRVFNSYQGLYF